MKSDLFDRFPLAVILILVVLFFWRLSLSQQFTFADNPDLAYQVLPWYQVQAKAWHEGIFPMWDPYHWAGQSLLGQMQPAAPSRSTGRCSWRLSRTDRSSSVGSTGTSC